MKHNLLLAALVLFGAAISGPVQAQQELNYVAVEPCRVADTRKSSMGVINANTSRNFRVYGDADDLAVQGGQADCANPKANEEPLAVSAYIVAVPAQSSTRGGILTAYPSNESPPPAGTGATLNFARDQIIGNTTIATLCDASQDSCPPDGGLAILARDTNEHVVIDVQGYFYASNPIPGYVISQTPFAVANANTVNAEAMCPEGKKVLGGGGSLVDPTWVLDSSNPRPDGLGWQVRYKTTGANFSATGSAWAVCATVN